MSLIVSGVSIENLIVINSKTGEQVDVETLQEPLGNILFQKQTAPEWLNYTALDSAGNVEGTTAYSGTAVAYAIGKPTISSGSATYAEANGLNEEYFSNKYGSNFVKNWLGTAAAPLQCVEDVLVIPDTYNGLPITKILDKAFTARTIVSSIETRYQPYFYTNIVFGKNIKTLGDMCFAGTGDKIELIDLPTTIKSVAQKSFGDTKAYNSVVRFNSNTAEQGVLGLTGATNIADYIPKVIYGRGVTQVYVPTSAAGSVLVFEHQKEDVLSISYETTSVKNAIAITIYAENDSALYFGWEDKNMTPTYYHLDGTLWGMASVTRTISGAPLDANNYKWTLTGNADYFIVSYGDSYQYSGNTCTISPLSLFSNQEFCMNMSTYSEISVTAYKANCLKVTKSFTISGWSYAGADSDGKTGTSTQAVYGFAMGYNTSTDTLVLKTNSTLASKVEYYRLYTGYVLGTSTPSTPYVDIYTNGAIDISVNIKNYASQLGLVAGNTYRFNTVAKLKNSCYVYASVSAANYLESVIYGGN